MKLMKLGKQSLLAALRLNGTRQGFVDRIAKEVGTKPLKWASDGTWTVVVCGDHIGVAKRATYAGMADEESVEVGLSIAASRL